MYKGIEKNQNYTWLICAAQNMKIIAIICKRKGKSPLNRAIIFTIFEILFKTLKKLIIFLIFIKSKTNLNFKYWGLSTL